MATPETRLPRIADLEPVPMNELDTPGAATPTEWLWHGLIARRNITLLTSQWKAGKTTLVTGLVQQMATGGTFLDRPVEEANVMILSEESKGTWADRARRTPFGEHCLLLARPLPCRPTPEEWEELIDLCLEHRRAGDMEFLVIDPLARFLPGKTDCDLNALHLMLDPLQRLAEADVGILMLHHPRKKRSEEGTSARGHGGLLAAVDIIVELSRYGSLQSDERRRKLFAVSRFPETPKELVYEWDAVGRFVYLGDPLAARFHDNWEVLKAVLAKRKKSATHQELWMDWPADQPRPERATLYEWLNRAFDRKLVRRFGSGRKADPYRYRLPNELDEFDGWTSQPLA